MNKRKLLSILTGRLGIFAVLGVIAVAAGLYFGIRGCAREESHRKVYRQNVLYEVNNARHSLAYTLVCLEQNWSCPVTFDLLNAQQVPELFAEDSALVTDVRSLYDSLNAAKKDGDDLRNLLGQKNYNREAIKRRERSIFNTVILADQVGPRIASSVGGNWEVPPSNLTAQELTKYYIGKTHSGATDDAGVFGIIGDQEHNRKNPNSRPGEVINRHGQK